MAQSPSCKFHGYAGSFRGSPLGKSGSPLSVAGVFKTSLQESDILGFLVAVLGIRKRVKPIRSHIRISFNQHAWLHAAVGRWSYWARRHLAVIQHHHPFVPLRWRWTYLTTQHHPACGQTSRPGHNLWAGGGRGSGLRPRWKGPQWECGVKKRGTWPGDLDGFGP